MDVKTQNYLRELDLDQNGLKISELKSLDSNKDNKLSILELNNNVNNKDINSINAKFSQAQTTLKYLSIPMFDHLNEDTVNVYSRAELNSELFPGGVEGISANDIDQGGLNDCYFLASLASLAEQRPRAIINMINENKDGTFTVELPGSKEKVTVSKPTDEELSKYAHKGENGSTWVAVLEKAYAQSTYKQVEKFNMFSPFPIDFSPRDTIDNGGLLSTGIQMVTGNDVDTDIIALTRKSTTRRKLQEALSNNRVVTASTFLDGSDSKNIHGNHVYSILSYDSSKDSVRVRNPWGSGSDAVNIKNPDSVNDGTFTLTIDELDDYFSMIAYEQED